MHKHTGELAPDAAMVDRDAWQVQIADREELGSLALGNIREPLGILDLADPTTAYNALIDVLKRTDDEVARTHVRALEVASFPSLLRDDSPPLSQIKAVDIHAGILKDPKVREIIETRDLYSGHRELLAEWGEFKDSFTLGIKLAIAEDYIPPVVEDRLADAFDMTTVRVADAAALEAMYEDSAAFYESGEDEIVIRHDAKQKGRGFYRYLVHEFMHKLSGGTFLSIDEAGSYHRPRVGFGSEMPSDALSRVGLNEAVTHHLTLGVLDGDFETFDPDQRDDGDMGYYNYRKILATLIDRSDGLIDVRTITNAFFEDTSPDDNITLRRELLAEVNEAYGPGALNKLETLCQLAGYVRGPRARQHLFQHVLSRIHHPIVYKDEVEPGWIDLENLPDAQDLVS